MCYLNYEESEMKIIRNKYESQIHMIRPTFELTHLRDAVPGAVEAHRHEFYEVYYMNSGGEISYEVETNTYTVRPGDVMIINCLDAHRPILNKDAIYDRILLWFSLEFLKDISSTNSDLAACFSDALHHGKNLIRMGPSALGQFTATLGKLEKAYFGKKEWDDLLIRSYLVELLVIINREYEGFEDEEIENFVSENVLIDKVLAYINENLAENLNLDILAEYFFISKFHLLRQFKKTVGYTIHQYILNKRFQLAEKYLKENMPANKVCFECGFNNYASFFQAFMKRYGMSPRQFVRLDIRYNESSAQEDQPE